MIPKRPPAPPLRRTNLWLAMIAAALLGNAAVLATIHVELRAHTRMMIVQWQTQQQGVSLEAARNASELQQARMLTNVVMENTLFPSCDPTPIPPNPAR